MKRRESQALLEQIRKRGSRESGTAREGTSTNASSIVIEDDGGDHVLPGCDQVLPGNGNDNDSVVSDVNIGNGNGCDESGGGDGSAVDC